jgi:phage/plasmid-like protein (TIGR03299 family)
MAHKLDNVLTVGDRAWHGLDQNLESMSVADIQEKVLNFEPVYFPLGMTDPVTEQIVQAEHRAVYRVPTSVFDASHVEDEAGYEKFSLKTCKGLISSNFDNCRESVVKLSEVGPSYNPLYNRDLLRITRPIWESGLVNLETAGTLFNGKKVWIQGKLTEYEPVKGDTRLGYLVAINAHDSSIAPGFVFTEVRVVCNNTYRLMMDSKISRRLQVRHSSQVVENFEELAETLDMVNAQFLVHTEKLKKLAEITIQSEEQIRQICKVAYGVTERKGRTEDAIVEAFETAPGNNQEGIRGTGLALHEAFTYYLTHIAGNKNTTEDHRKDSNLFNTLNAKFVGKVDATILAIAG